MNFHGSVFAVLASLFSLTACPGESGNSCTCDEQCKCNGDLGSPDCPSRVDEMLTEFREVGEDEDGQTKSTDAVDQEVQENLHFFIPAYDCTLPPWDVYLSPNESKPYSPQPRGEIVKCAVNIDYSVEYISNKMLALAEPVPEAVVAARTFTILYRTQRFDGSGGFSTAVVYVPKLPTGAESVDFVVVAHGTTGLADYCAPSVYTGLLDYLVLPFLSRGIPVIAPDYAGLGTEGVQGYGDRIDTGYSVLDAARAMHSFLGNIASGNYIVAGHSQGGQAALAAQVLQPEYGPEGMKAAIAFAPAPIHTDFTNTMDYPQLSLWLGAGITGAAIAMRLYADFANLLGKDQAGYPFAPDIRKQLVQSIDYLCAQSLATIVPSLAPTLGDLLSDQFEENVKQCKQGNCSVEPVKKWVEKVKKNIMVPSTSDVAVVILSGTEDIQITPKSVACTVKWFQIHGINPVSCLVAGADHFTLVQKTSVVAYKYAMAFLQGAPLPECNSQPMPECWQL